MVALRWVLALLVIVSAAHAAVPAALEDPDVLLGDADEDIGEGWVQVDPPLLPPPVPPTGVFDIDELLEPPPYVNLPRLPRWQLATRDALTFDTWPPDLDQGREGHRRAMDLVDRGIIPLRGGWFCPDAGVTRVELVSWLAHVEDWVQLAKAGLSLDVKVSRHRDPCPVRLILRLGLVAPGRPFDGDRAVDRAFLLRILWGLERSWMFPWVGSRLGFPDHDLPDRAAVAVWLRDVAQELCRVGRVPTMPVDPRSLAHLAAVLEMLNDPSPVVRQSAHRVLSGLEPAVLATLIAARSEEWFRDPVAIESLPETAAKLGAAAADESVARAFATAMRILRGLNSPEADRRFVRRVQQQLAQTPMEEPLPQRLIAEAVATLVAHKDLASLNHLLNWGMPVVDALIPHLERKELDRHWAERMPYAIEPGWDQRGRGVAAQLKRIACEPLVPAPTRASALERLARLGETLTREQARESGLLPADPDGSRERLARNLLRVVEPPPAIRVSRAAPRLQADDEVQRLNATIRAYQIYLAIALLVLVLMAAIHLAVLVPMIAWRLLTRLKRWVAPAGKVLPDDMPLP